MPPLLGLPEIEIRLEEVLETIGRGTTKAAGDAAEQIQIYRALGDIEGSSRLRQARRHPAKHFTRSSHLIMD